MQGTRRKIQNPKNKIQKKRNKTQGARDKAQEPKPNKQNPKNKIVYYNSAVVVVHKVNRRFVGLFDTTINTQEICYEQKTQILVAGYGVCRFIIITASCH